MCMADLLLNTDYVSIRKSTGDVREPYWLPTETTNFFYYIISDLPFLAIIVRFGSIISFMPQRLPHCFFVYKNLCISSVL
jgi:hypothetical protein